MLVGSPASKGHRIRGFTEMISEKDLITLLKSKEEKDTYDFKRELNVYDKSTGKKIDPPSDELIKDILGFANGNSRTIKKFKYIIIGACDKEVDSDGMRKLVDVSYKVPEENELIKWVNGACSPAVVGIETEFFEIKNTKIYVIAIPPTFELHETTKDLKNGKYLQHTVFMRQGEHIRPASVRDGTIIQQLKLQYRNEVINPSAPKFGAGIAAVVGVLFWNSASKNVNLQSLEGLLLQLVIVITAAIMGAIFGGCYTAFSTTRYEWPYMSKLEKGRAVFIVVFSIAMYALLVSFKG